MPNYNSWTPQNNVMPSWSPNMQYPQPPAMADAVYRPQQQPVNNLLRVTGPESAKAYSLPPNSSVALFDADNPIFYIKSTDDSGFATLRTFEFAEKPVQSNQIEVQPADNGELKEMKDQMLEMQANINALKELMEGLVS